MKPRGLRNHNPGNLRRSNDPWQGLATTQTDPEFFQFKSAPWGIRALARTLITYQDKYGYEWIDHILQRWAPYVENDTGAYIHAVLRDTGFSIRQSLDLHTYAHMAPLVKAIIKHENGMQPYPDSVIDKGLSLAGVEPEKPKSLQRSRTVKGAQVAMAGGTVATVTGVAAALEPVMPILREIAEFGRDHPYALLIGVGAAVLLGAGWALWAKIDDRNRGIA